MGGSGISGQHVEEHLPRLGLDRGDDVAESPVGLIKVHGAEPTASLRRHSPALSQAGASDVMTARTRLACICLSDPSWMMRSLDEA